MKGDKQMKKLTYILTFVICILISPNISKATCDYSRQAELSKIASNIQFSTNYEVIEGTETSVSYIVTITNLTNDIYIVDNNGNRIIAAGEYNVNYNNPSKKTFNIYSNDNNCKGQKLLTKYVNLPVYNPYSDSTQCEENPNFKYCNMWEEININDDEFYEAYEQYIDNQSETTNKQTNNQKKDIIAQYKTELIISLIGLIIIITIIIIKKVKK